MVYDVIESMPVDKNSGVLSDETMRLIGTTPSRNILIRSDLLCMKTLKLARSISKRLRGYVLTCFQWFPTFVFQNPNESKMETKEMVISAQAAKLYELKTRQYVTAETLTSVGGTRPRNVL